MRDQLILLLLHGGGLRESEALSIWITDVFIDDENIALVRVYSETVVVDYQRRKVDQVTKLFGLQKTAITEC